MAGDPDEGWHFLSQREIENLPVSCNGVEIKVAYTISINHETGRGLVGLPGIGLALVDGGRVVMESSW